VLATPEVLLDVSICGLTTRARIRWWAEMLARGVSKSAASRDLIACVREKRREQLTLDSSNRRAVLMIDGTEITAHYGGRAGVLNCH
jgi:hypothetical protein